MIVASVIDEIKIDQISDVCSLIRESIIKLYAKDHENDPVKLGLWLENKTEENGKNWFLNDTSKAFVTIVNEEIIGVSHIDKSGYLFLCYVLSKVKGQGFGSLLLKTAESQTLEWGINEIMLESTVTAKGFYERHGYRNNGNPVLNDNMVAYPLIKTIKA